MTRMSALAAAACAAAIAAPAAHAKRLTQQEVVATMVGKPIVTRQFGVKVNLRFAASGAVKARTILGNFDGKWKRGAGDEICTTFPTGPAKGTQCVTYEALGDNRFRTSKGTVFSVID